MRGKMIFSIQAELFSQGDNNPLSALWVYHNRCFMKPASMTDEAGFVFTPRLGSWREESVDIIE